MRSKIRVLPAVRFRIIGIYFKWIKWTDPIAEFSAAHETGGGIK